MSKQRIRSSVKRDLEEIIETCSAIEDRKFNPFLLNVSEALSILRQNSLHLTSIDEHLLDMRAITGIAKVVGLQSAQLRFQSSSLFVDPENAKQKIHSLSRQQLATLFLLSWHPIVELEQLTSATVSEALGYWSKLLSFFERRRRLDAGPLQEADRTGLGDLEKAGFLDDKGFAKRLRELWEELKEKATREGLKYWTFVKSHSFSETVLRAQLVSFLVTYGYAKMERKGSTIFLLPNDKPEILRKGSPLSLPISIPTEMVKNE